MNNSKTSKDTNEIIDAIAEQWVNLLLTHIETKKQKKIDVKLPSEAN